MSDERKPPTTATTHRKVQSDERGKSVWVDPIQTAEFELVSTQKLKAVLDAEHAHERDEIARIAAGDDDGYLARNSNTGHFQIIDDASLQAILDQQAGQSATPAAQREPPAAAGSGDDEELMLVSTQALRQILGTLEEQPKKRALTRPSRDEGGGFDPYNTS